jgi:hypothetical protein
MNVPSGAKRNLFIGANLFSWTRSLPCVWIVPRLALIFPVTPRRRSHVTLHIFAKERWLAEVTLVLPVRNRSLSFRNGFAVKAVAPF